MSGDISHNPGPSGHAPGYVLLKDSSHSSGPSEDNSHSSGPLEDSSHSSGPLGQPRSYIISPDDLCYRIWEGFLAMLVLYTAWASFLELGFLKEPLQPFSTFDKIADGLFLINIVVHFFVAYRDRTTNLLVYNQRQIARRNISPWLAFDFISSIPSEFVMKIPLVPFSSYGFVSIFRLWRLHKVNTLFARLEEDRRFNYYFVRCVKLILVLLLAVHGAGCIFYLIADLNPNPGDTWIGENDESFAEKSIWVNYFAAVYWSITTISTVGYGDLHPRNKGEMIFVTCYMLVNFGLGSYLLDNATKLVVHGNGRTKRLRDASRVALGFAQRKNLSISLQNQIIQNLQSKFESESEELQEQEDIIASLPQATRSKIFDSLFHSTIANTYLFRRVSGCLLFQLASEMKEEYFSPGADIILKNALPTDLYILVSGVAELIDTKENGVEQVVQYYNPRDICGEIGVLCRRPQLFTVRAYSSSQLLRLDRTKLLTILETNPADSSLIIENLLKHLGEFHDTLMIRVREETERLIARGGMDLPLSPRFALARGYEILFLKSLKQGRDPSETDPEGKTALHICAHTGIERHVHLLLKYDADPNCRDSNGHVPLWEAMLAGHEPVSRVLYDHGARLSAEDHGLYACTAAERDDLDLLKNIVRHGGTLTGLGEGMFMGGSSRVSTTALHIAACKANVEMFRYLLEQDCDLDLEDGTGMTAKQFAKLRGIPGF